jgi:cell division protein FtsN
MMITHTNDKNFTDTKHSYSRDTLVTGINKSAVRWLVAGLSLILFAAIIGLSYSIGVGDAEKGAIPIIRADGTAIKVRPDNPGGRKYPHQDLTIYNSFRSDILEKDVQLKDDIEKPVSLLPNKQDISGNDMPASGQMNNPPSTNDNVGNNSDKIQLMTVSEAQTPEVQPVSTEKTDIIQAQDKIQAEEAIKKIVTQSTVAKPVVAKPVVAKPVVLKIEPVAPKPIVQNGKAYLQIGAFRSEADALGAFKRAKGKFSELASVSPVIVKADLGAKGVYYRLRVGPFDGKQKSLNVCSGLKAKGQPCLYIAQ